MIDHWMTVFLLGANAEFQRAAREYAEEYAAMAVAAERERCAALCEQRVDTALGYVLGPDCAAAIRGAGQGQVDRVVGPGYEAPRLEALQGLLETAQLEAHAGREAVATLASEREANALLTKDAERLRTVIESIYDGRDVLTAAEMADAADEALRGPWRLGPDGAKSGGPPLAGPLGDWADAPVAVMPAAVPAWGHWDEFKTAKQAGAVAGDGKPCPNDHDPDCRWPQCRCRETPNARLTGPKRPPQEYANGQK